MDRNTRVFDFGTQSFCLVALLDSSNGQVFYLKSPGSETVPLREQKMMTIIASSAIYAKMSTQSEVTVEGAVGSACHIVWKTVSSSLMVLILGSMGHFQNAAALDDSAAMISSCCEFLFGNILSRGEESIGSLRLQHGQMTLLGRFIDSLFNYSSHQEISPLTFQLPLIEVCPSDESAAALCSCLNSFCDSINASGSIIFSSGKILLISSRISEIMDTTHLRCFIVICVAIRAFASETTTIRNRSSSIRSLNSLQNVSATSAPASFDLFIPDKKEKDKYVGFHVLCTAVPVESDGNSNLYSVFLFPAVANEELLPENVSAEVCRYWSPILNSRYEQALSKESSVLGVTNLIEQTSFSKKEPSTKSNIGDKFSPMMMCIANSKSQFCCIPPSITSPNSPALHARLVYFISKALKQFCSSQGTHQQTLARRPSAICLRYPDAVCVAISRPPINVYAILPAASPLKEAINFVSELGFETYMQSHFLLCE